MRQFAFCQYACHDLRDESLSLPYLLCLLGEHLLLQRISTKVPTKSVAHYYREFVLDAD